MATGTFSQQLAQRQQQQQGQSRLTRTQRLLQQAKARAEQSRLKQLQEQAEIIRARDFSNITSLDEYRQKYSRLSPDIRQFFLTPDEVQERQQQQIEAGRQTAMENITRINNRIKEEEDRIARMYDQISRGEGNYQSTDTIRSSEEEIQVLQAEKKGYEEALRRNAIDPVAFGNTYLTMEQRRQREREHNIAELEAYNRTHGTAYTGLWQVEEAEADRYNNAYNSWRLDNQLIDAQNKTIEAERLKQEQDQKEAETFLQQNAFGENVSFNRPDETTWQKIWSGMKTGYLSSLFGWTGFNAVESKLKELTLARYQGIREAVTPNFKSGMIKGVPSFDVYKLILNIPLDKSYETVEYMEDLDYKKREATKLLDQLEQYSGQVSPDAKSYLQMKGLEILKSKGLGMEKTSTEETVGGVTTTTETMEITDPAFERRISGYIYEKEIARKMNTNPDAYLKLYPSGTMVSSGNQNQGLFLAEDYANYPHAFSQELFNVNGKIGRAYSNVNTLSYTPNKPYDIQFEQQKIKIGKVPDLAEDILDIRAFSTKAVESYAIVKGIGLVGRGLGWTYKSLGGGLGSIESITKTGTFKGTGVLEKTQTLVRTELSEGYLFAPRNWQVLKTIGVTSLTGVWGYAKYKQYQQYKSVSPVGKSAFWVETAGEFAGFELATGFIKRQYDRMKSQIDNWNLKTRKQADLSQTPFRRANKRLGFQEDVYMKRYQGLQWNKPRTWIQKLRGYEKGEFTGRYYKQIPDEVQAFYKYGGDVVVTDKGGKIMKIVREPTMWELQRWSEGGTNIFQRAEKYTFRGRNAKTGKFQEVDLIQDTTRTNAKILRTVKAEPFPYAPKSEHLKLAIRGNLQKYGVGNYADLPIDIKKIKAFGYSATPERWNGGFEPSEIVYDGGKILKLQGGLRYYSVKGVSAGFLRLFQKATEESAFAKSPSSPTIYAGYFDKVKVNKAIREIKGMTGERELKAYLYSKKVSPNELNIALYKKEAEGTAEITNAITIREKYAMQLAGWKVPIVEEIYRNPSQLSISEAKAIIKEMGSIKTSIPRSSTLPSIPSRYVFSVVSSPKSASYYKSIISKISEISRKSKPSEPSPSSRASEVSRASSSLVSDILSRISTSRSVTSRTYEYPRSRVPKTPPIEIGLSGKMKALLKRKRTPEIVGLFPDFTARAIGLAPKRIGSVKDALKEMSKIQTGFEIRTGARIKGFKNIQEKNLLKGIMA